VAVAQGKDGIHWWQEKIVWTLMRMKEWEKANFSYNGE
jgi:hypothetical protein